MHDGFFLFPFFSMAGFGLLGLIWLVLWIWALISTIRSGESDGAIVAWILVLIFIPLLGLNHLAVCRPTLQTNLMRKQFHE